MHSFHEQGSIPLHITLASASPNRKNLLLQSGFSLEVVAPHIYEVLPITNPSELVKTLSRHKAQNVIPRSHTRIVLAADTVVYIHKRILGKPKNKKEAAEMLELLSGKSHTVYTGYALYDRTTQHYYVGEERAKISFITIDNALKEWYLDNEQWHLAAGAYRIQGLGSAFISHMKGTYATVLGLPLCPILQILRKLSITP